MFENKKTPKNQQAQKVEGIGNGKQNMSRKKLKIGACGFETIDPRIDWHIIKDDRYTIYFFETDNHEYSLDSYDGIIIKSGAFEERIKSETEWDVMGQDIVEVSCNPDAILARDREIQNLVKDNNNWFIFLIGKIVDRARDNNSFIKRIKYTDLCTKVLNRYDMSKRLVENECTNLKSKSDCFKSYTEKYAIGSTEISNSSKDYKVLISSPDGTVFGGELNNQAFFLPFHISNPNIEQIKEAVQSAVEGTLSYRKEHEISSPEWLNEISFREEKKMKKDLEEISKAYKDCESKLKKIQLQKCILTTKGQNLANLINEILTDYFGLKIDSEDKGKEDCKILDENSDPLCLIEIKGSTSGIKNQQIGQFIGHRENNGLSPKLPGIMIINDKMKIDGFSERAKVEVKQDQINIAVKLDVLILRTIDLLKLMLKLEESSVEERKKEFMKLIGKNGWLTFSNSNDEYSIKGRCQ